MERIDLSSLGVYAKDKTMLYFWVNVLLMAGPEGSFTTSVRRLAMDLRMSVQQVRTCLSKLASNTLATHQSTQFATQITICESVYCKDEQHTSNTLNNTRATHPKKKAPSSSPDGSFPHPSSLSPLLFPQEEVQKDEVSGDTSQKPDFSFVLRMWNDSMTGPVPKIKGLSQSRKEKMKLRIDEMGGWEEAKRILEECFRKINESDFCNGRGSGEQKWVATFDWFFSNEKNWLKVIEGNYDNRNPQSRVEQYAATADRFNALMDELYGPDNNGTTNGPGYTPDEQ